MSWGYFADLHLSMDVAAWQELRDQRPSDTQLDPGWSGLENKDLEEMFGRPNTGSETFAQVLTWKCYTGNEAIANIESEGARTRVRVCLMLDKSLLDLAYPLATLLTAARTVGAEGSLRLVNDGTAVGEDGVELVLSGGTIKSQRIEDCWPIVEQLGAELFAGVFEAAPKAARRTIINPFTGEPINLADVANDLEASERPDATAGKKSAAKKTAAKKTSGTKTAAKKPVAKKPAPKKTAAKKTAAKKPAAKKTAAKKPAAKNTSAKKTATKRAAKKARQKR